MELLYLLPIFLTGLICLYVGAWMERRKQWREWEKELSKYKNSDSTPKKEEPICNICMVSDDIYKKKPDTPTTEVMWWEDRTFAKWPGIYRVD